MNDRIRMNVIRVTTPDIDKDEQVWIQSTIAETHKLKRGFKDDFSFTRNDLAMISNRGESSCTLTLNPIQCAEGGIYIGSNRRAGRLMREIDTLTIRMKPGEVLTVRSLHAVEPGIKHADGSPVMIRPGQSIGAIP